MSLPRPFRLAGVTTGCLAMGLVTGIAAQQPRTPVFTAGTTYVSLDVVVTDRDGRPVRDLRREEFVVVERGRPQTIEDFEFVSIPVSRTTIDLDVDPPPASDVAVNTLSRTASRALAIVVDDTRLSPTEIVPIRRTLRALLESLAPEDQVALTYVGRSDLARDFTSDHGQLIHSVNSLSDAIGMPPLAQPRFSDAGAAPGSGAAVQLTGLLRPSWFDSLRNVVDSLGAARQARKAIVLVNTSGCLPHDRAFGDWCRTLIERAKRAGVPIYGLNPLGLMDAMSSDGAGAFNTEDERAGIETDLAAATDSLRVLASETGGRAFVRSNLRTAVEEVMADNGNFYLLGYYPRPVPNDGRFHEVDVTVTRPGLHVRAKAGYTADGGRPRALTIVGEMTKHLGSGLPDPSLPMRGFVAPIGQGRRGTTAIVTAELRYPIPEGGFSGDFADEWRFGVLALDADGRIKTSFQRDVSLNGRWKPGAQGTFVLNEVVELPSGTVTVRIGVTSRSLNRTGTVHVPVTVPDFGRRELQLSPLVLGHAGEAVVRADVAVGLDRLNGLVPFPPTTERAFQAGERVRVYSRVSWRSKDAILSAEVQFVGSPQLPGGLEGPLEVTTARNGHHHAVLDFTIATDGLSPGSHVLRVVARLSGGESITRDVPLTIRP